MPVSGRGDGPDVLHKRLAIECKARSSLPGWMKKGMAQARQAALPEQLPTLILHEAGRPHSEDWIIHRLGDYVEWYGPVVNAEEEEEGPTRP